MLPVLPPCFESKETHTYGELTIRLTHSSDSKLKIAKIQPHLFGSNKKVTKSVAESQSLAFKFSIATNLWHFYAYLSDCRSIAFMITDYYNQTYTCEMPIHLLPSGQVLHKTNKNIDFLFRNNAYLLQAKQKLKIFDSNKRAVSTVQAQLMLKFDQDINRVVFEAAVINFEDLLIIDQISPIPSSIQLENFEEQPNEKPQIVQKVPQQIAQKPLQPPKQPKSQKMPLHNIQKPKENHDFEFLQNHFTKMTHNLTPIVPKNFEEDEKMVQDDIDRLIAEMQNRPYDSSRYVQSQNPSQKKENVNFVNTSPLEIYSNQKMQTRTNYGNYPQLIPPKYPSSNRAGSVKESLSPLKSNSIYSYSAIPVQSERVNYLMNKTTMINRDMKRSAEKSSGKVQSKEKHQILAQKGTIRLKIHQLMMQRYDQDLSLILKCYLNDDSDQYYTVNGVKQGETISFSSNMLINEQREIHFLRFTLIDSYDMKTIFASGEFEMQRLFALRPTKGVFTVNMKSNQAQRASSRSKVVNVDQSRLVKVTPNLKTLRIELQYEQHIQIVQIYFSLSCFNKAVKICRYKVPMTKETIEFNINQLSNSKHVNIFPHNRSSQTKAHEKIILQLWGVDQLLGISQISLKQLQNTNQRIIASSLEPIYLYDEDRNVQNIKGGKMNNMLHLQLYYGTISQVQGLLNQGPRREQRQYQKKHVQVEEMLGVYVKQRKKQVQVQIQVNQIEMCEPIPVNEKVLSKKTSLGLKQQELPDQEQDQTYKDQQLQNQFLNKSLEQKYLSQQTVPIFTKLQNKCQELNFKKTQQSVPLEGSKVKPVLKSLTTNFQQLIKENLSDFSKEENLKQLKLKVKDHLLYNFIELDNLKLILKDLGVSNKVSNVLLDEVVGHSNGMININVLYDMIYGLMLDGVVKEKYIDDSQLAKYCLSQLYTALQSEQERDLQNFLFDSNLQYEECKKVFEKIGFKLTMSQYNKMEAYTKRMKESSRLNQKSIKQSLLFKVKSHQKEEKEKDNYQKEVLKKLYQPQWDQEDDFFISNINSPQQNPSNVSVTNQHTSKSYNTLEQSIASVAPKIEATSHENKVHQKPTILQSNILVKKAQLAQNPVKKAQQSKNSIEPCPFNFRMFIQGLQNCIETTQCHLNMSLNNPKLKVIYKDQNKQSQVVIGKERSSIQLSLQKQKEYLDGSIELISGSTTIAKCYYSIIVDLRSVYTLKSINQGQICGLLYLRFSPL